MAKNLFQVLEDGDFVGFTRDILQELSESLNFTIEFVKTHDGEWNKDGVAQYYGYGIGFAANNLSDIFFGKLLAVYNGQAMFGQIILNLLKIPIGSRRRGQDSRTSRMSSSNWRVSLSTGGGHSSTSFPTTTR